MKSSPEMAMAPPSIFPGQGDSYSNYSSNNVETKIQVTGNLSIEVTNIDETIETLQTLISQYGGRITNSDSREFEVRYANVTILIPSKSFDELLNSIKGISVKVKNENISANDVTEEFIDIESNLNVMKNTESRFLALFSETENVEEILQVEIELMRIRGNIDSLEGRMNYLNKTTNNSILNLSIEEKMSVTGNSWSVVDSFNDSIREFVSFSKHLANLIIKLVIFSPVIIIIGLVVFFVFKYGNRLYKILGRKN
jgi:hypothetical protein